MGRSRLAVLAFVVAVTLSGCVPSAPTPKPDSASTSTSTPRPIRTADPVFIPNGTAAENKLFFDLTNKKLFASNGSANGRAIIDNLVTAGFDKAAMQVTPDKTPTNGSADSILFSVRIGDSCLLGQYGGGYSSAVEPVLAGGGCLIGKTRPIDW